MKKLAETISESFLSEAKKKFSYDDSYERVDKHKNFMNMNGGSKRVLSKFGQEKFDRRMSRIQPHLDFINNFNENYKTSLEKAIKDANKLFKTKTAKESYMASYAKKRNELEVSVVIDLGGEDSFVMVNGGSFVDTDSKEYKEFEKTAKKSNFEIRTASYDTKQGEKMNSFNHNKIKLYLTQKL